MDQEVRMNEKKKARSINEQGSLLKDTINYFRLVIRLMADARINPFLKLIPIGALIYLINPFDFPFILDDAAVLGLGIYSFVEFCPKDIVEEHMKILNQTIAGNWQDPPAPEQKKDDQDVIDAEFRDTDAKS
jgi:uncharacterized membrane protein YkvA (DUF1232 family)